MLDLLIKNGKVVDGTGKNKPQDLDVGVKNGEISELGNLKGARAKKVIDANGLLVSPGFIDAQNHSDAYWTLFDYPGQESMISQGITTIALGNCGASLAPLPSLESFKSIQKWHSPEGENINWTYFEEYLAELSKLKLGVNILSLAGHSTIRRGLLGDVVRKISDNELEVLERVLISAMKAGAFGLSYGLVYAHEYDSSTDEVVRLAKIATKFNRPISIHLRNEAKGILDSISEVINISGKARARTKISHLKIRDAKNWGLFEQVLKSLELAYRQGVDVRYDVYPYTTSWSILYTYLPKWVYQGGKVELNKKLQEPFQKNKIIEALREETQDFSKIIIATATSAPHLIGKSLVQIAGSQGVTVEEALVNVLESTESEVVVFDENIDKNHLEEFLKHPLGMISTNGAGFSVRNLFTKNLVHPRCFGAMPRFLSMSLKNKWLTPEKAVYKITGMPAEYLGLKDRGFLKKGKKADITVFDPKNIQDLATVDNPYQPSLGIEEVILNGEMAFENGVATAEKSGKVLKARS
ncbi:MAG: hypothetical protein COT91_02550 [Candidatus Doudnabacteria bacterium CG10_big_fil_rev_8_21_14_0_10_41_10]|uniref:Amidohydrolase 3 domain-containing protein n=1 Tax=Candidatus Doudnabacteria bacterium CG10_big_fil_rev_8_21_14_0_10_41_10 TaxID=1974551 RepID=A0A2H0VG11_9BACT|nr:MAG: hypothetical protein COT91_02550 [Candidatus Doudnabacteria bacterium CG10_big_fil_rev_8_21_14_0_10_41_10]